MSYETEDEVIEEHFESRLSRYQSGLETSMNGGDFILRCVNLLNFKCHKINLNHVKSYIDSSDWIKNNQATINPFNDDDKCFQYAVTVTLNLEKNEKNLQRISKTKPYKCNKCKYVQMQLKRNKSYIRKRQIGKL